ncbi:C1D-domain-containing protein [Daedalea quercina L-15889]|uniref:Exosome complex protein n=1 Tax=Daedalea quercina L-15889 TaxID=1314783 RepID=A0A165TC70_9APHY|nr:C1D-domain-containing protein [Daedalea quercina L-15889]
MDADPQRLRAKVAALENSLDDLETQLEPLLAQTLPESLVGLETIQQAKLQVALPYLVYDLIFIYLKTRGIDPKTHPVVTELDRIRQYFDKIKNAEDPEKRTTAVDKAAANRFIKHAIAQVTAQRPPGDDESPSHMRFNEGSEPTKVPVKVTSKMAARAQYQKELAEAGSEEEEAALEVIDDEEVSNSMVVDPEKDKGKGRAVDNDDVEPSPPGRKRRRPAMDPFAGYGDEQWSPAQDSKKPKSVVEGAKASDSTPLDSGRSTPLSGSEAAKKAKKAEKKARKKAKRKESTG